MPDVKVSCPFLERRSQKRPLLTMAASILDPASGARTEAHTTDVTLGGCYLDTMNPYPAGSMLDLRLTNNGESFHSLAKVIYSKSGVGMGLLFSGVEQDQFSLLKAWLADGRGEPNGKPRALELDETARCGLEETDQLRHALEDLVVQLMRKGLLNDEEGEPILRHLLH